MSNKYENAKIYKITSIHSDLIYIGSTIQKRLSSRKSGHICNYKRWINNGFNYTSSYELIKLGGIDICLIEEYSCENKEQLHKRERYYIENTINCVNKYIPIRNKEEYNKEYREKYKDKKNEYNKIYELNNKDKIKCRAKEYRESNKEKANKYYLENKDKRQEYLNKKKDILFENRKKYREENKDSIKEEQHKYYLENKEKKKEYNKQYYQKKKLM